MNRNKTNQKRSKEKLKKWHVQAIWHKFCIVSFREKIKLLLKLILRLFGIRKCLFLGGYCKEEDNRQLQQDKEAYLLLKERKKEEFSSTAIEIEEPNHSFPSDTAAKKREKLQELLKQRKTYIALLTETLDTGGLEEVIRTLALEYCARQLPVRIFCIQKGGRIAEELKKAGIQVIEFYGKKEILEAYLEQDSPFLVNSHYGIHFLEIFQQHKIPVVEVIHNMYVFLPQKQLLLEQEKTKLVDRYIAVSETAKEVFLQKIPQADADKISVVGNAVQRKQELSLERKKVRKLLGISEDTFVYLSVGSIDARKNQLGILRAWDVVHRILSEKAILVIAGGGTDYEYEKKVQWLLKDRGLENSVIMTGHSKEVSSLMDASDVFVLSSYYEGWSMAATEALCSGLPLIHSQCGSGRELIAGGKNGILTDNPLQEIAAYNSICLYNAMHAGINENIVQVAEAMLKMFYNKDRWKAQREERIQYAVQNFSLDQMINHYFMVYLEAWQERQAKIEWSKGK